ncbi:TPA: FkbM family methyltransferase [Candidatus Woesearchaeota archaeon]|nr:FkbM family methyltransferase [Candidatus Woesearchaeota archaeon]
MGFLSLFGRLPETKFKQMLKNVLFSLNTLTLGSHTYVLDGVQIKVGRTIFVHNPAMEVDLPGYLKNYTLKKGDVVIDGGAFEGHYVIYASKKVGPKGKVIAFEPDPYNYWLLERNIKRNKIDNVILVKKGLWNKDTKTQFIVDGVISRIVDVTDIEKTKALNTIDVVSLDAELRRLGIKKVSFIKMDVEGAEIEALRGARRTLKENNVHFAIASYHILPSGERSADVLARMMPKMGYQVSSGYPIHLTTYGWKKTARSS